jgi:hypothetical protein
MTKAVALGLGLILAALWSRGYVEDVKARDKGWRWQECRFQTLDKATWTAREEWLTARCATQKWAVPGGLAELDAIAQCESGWSRFAYNGDSDGTLESGEYAGIFQHVATSYAGRVRSYEPGSWEKGLSERWTNSRGQIVMSARMMAAVGLSPWACA